MLKDNILNTTYASYTNEKLKLNSPLPTNTTEDKWKKKKDAAIKTLERNSPEPRKPWINDKITKDKEERRKKV